MRALATAVAVAIAAAGPAPGASPGQEATPSVQDTTAAAVAGRGTGGQVVSGARLDELTRRVASKLRCVICQGLSIEDSPSELAQQMKAVVREQLAAGRTPEEVERYFVRTYGEWVLLEPEPTGFNLAVYLLPVLALLAGATVVVVAVKRWTRTPDERVAADSPEA